MAGYSSRKWVSAAPVHSASEEHPREELLENIAEIFDFGFHCSFATPREMYSANERVAIFFPRDTGESIRE